MKVLHAVYSAYPDPPGGTEIYVTTLCHDLRARGIGSTILAPGDRDESFERDGVRIRKFAAPVAPTLEQLYGASNEISAATFARVLDEEAPDVVHQHALSPAISGELVDHARRRSLPIVFTYHTPTVSCQRGTLMEHGRTPCDGRLDVARCTACTLEGLGTSEPASRLLSWVPDAGGRWLGSWGFAGGPWTALRMSSLLSLRHRELDRLLASVDRFVVLTAWVGEVLRANGVPEGKLVSSPHGIPLRRPPATTKRRDGETLRIAHLGRIDPTKGASIVIDAVGRLSNADIRLDVFGVVQHATASRLLDAVREAAAADPRIAFLPAIPSHEVVTTLSAYDLVAVPSQMLETGPLVVLEAFAAGVPVVASALGGLVDKIRDGVNGLLVRPHDSIAAWRDAIARCHDDRALVRSLARGTSAPRSSLEVAADMANLYASLVDRRVEAPAFAPLESPGATARQAR